MIPLKMIVSVPETASGTIIFFPRIFTYFTHRLSEGGIIKQYNPYG